MAESFVEYTGNGSSDIYTFTFPYVKAEDVRVSLDGVDTSDWSFLSTTSIQFDVPPSNGVLITIYRVTELASLESYIYPGSTIRSSDLNNNFAQLLYLNQETRDITVEASSGNISDGAITTAKIADGSVTLAKLADILYVVPG